MFWRKTVFVLIIIGCSGFVVLTLLAMLAYPGGTFTDPGSRGYSFFGNFFSELGMLRTHAGAPKTLSLALFVISLLLAAGSLALFFLALPRRFASPVPVRVLAWVGSILGLLSAFFFIGVAVFPVDGNLSLHFQTVMWAFRLFPAAILCYAVLFFHQQGRASVPAWELVIFLLLQVAYILLLELGPSFEGDAGRIIQAVGQKVIVYASILTAILQSAWMLRRQAGVPEV